MVDVKRRLGFIRRTEPTEVCKVKIGWMQLGLSYTSGQVRSIYSFLFRRVNGLNILT